MKVNGIIQDENLKHTEKIFGQSTRISLLVFSRRVSRKPDFKFFFMPEVQRPKKVMRFAGL